MGVSITFSDVTRYRVLQDEIEKSRIELEGAYDELQTSSEELEATNEELQSTIEELETTNEELQSSNEEMETMNEELHATNDELQTMNDELHTRTDELNQMNTFRESILASLLMGVVAVDSELKVLVWNKKAEGMWGLRADEVDGQSFFNLDIGLPVEKLRSGIRSILEGSAKSKELTVDAINRRGRNIRCRVACTPLAGQDSTIEGVIMLMEEKEVS